MKFQLFQTYENKEYINVMNTRSFWIFVRFIEYVKQGQIKFDICIVRQKII